LIHLKQKRPHGAFASVIQPTYYQRVIRTKMAPMKKLARSLKERIDNIVTYCTHGITNAVAEGINSKIMSIKRRAGGYRNIENFKTAVLFYCGGLDLDPR
jgi:transposase